jgi:hypothetical protein
MRTPFFIIQIAADNAARIRAIDLDRILSNCSDEELEPTAEWIKAQRPDLTPQLLKELGYQYEERRPA